MYFQFRFTTAVRNVKQNQQKTGCAMTFSVSRQQTSLSLNGAVMFILSFEIISDRNSSLISNKTDTEILETLLGLRWAGSSSKDSEKYTTGDTKCNMGDRT